MLATLNYIMREMSYLIKVVTEFPEDNHVTNK